MTADEQFHGYAELLWQRGLGLEAAAIRLAPRALWLKYDKPFPQVDPKSNAQILADTRWWEMALEALNAAQPALKAYIERNNVVSEMHDHVISLIARSKLIALGYELPRRALDKPIEIPTDVWSGKIDWVKSAVSGNELQFVAVRVIPKVAAEKLLGKLIPAPKPKPVGKPSVKREIVEGYKYLRERNQIDFSKPRTACDEQIRALLKLQYPDRAGTYAHLSDETFRIHIGILFKADRAKHR